MKKNFFPLFIIMLVSILTISCQQQQARRPVSHSSGEFMNASVERNKKLIKNEETKIDSIIQKNKGIQYIASKKGYWYYYENKNTTDTLRPKKGDIAYFDYEIKDLNGKVIYSDLELKGQTYRVDKQTIITGLQHGLKLMRKNETVTFLFPSHLAYGYHGDDRRIGTNEPIICRVTLTDFRPENKLNN
ncbi:MULTISPECIES: gliding motility-associated peptidyl-prolyl isomerase GldI [Flavobacterium]|uniref:Peptidyl-prolyl cis-trans isomerase n=1 Tax=Flavobacterium stagni TaxID=2506421 RepID=A0A4Q1KA71_9FLAO|nr:MULTISPECIES: gliding motility-associated peptidyl-prolyl isomerase GldI [Flavobacterium]RXR23250.1 gliding motility-associated peptidyl-prolyl isomerase GldI [Flavobacterium stagni]